MKPLALVLATIAIIAFATSRSAQPAEVSVRPSWQVAPATAGQSEAPRITSAVVESPVARQPSDDGGVWGTAPPTDALTAVTRSGALSWMPSRYGRNYLALPIGPGHRVEVCGPGGCWRTVSTDAGPNHEMLAAGRIADVAVGHWEDICGVPRRFGLCEGSWTLIDDSEE